MLAVIDHHQRPGFGQLRAARLKRRHPRQRPHPDRDSQRLDHQLRVGQRRQINPPHPVGKVIQRFGGKLQRQTRLTGPAGTSQP
jgi:hypothetical protein